MIRFPKAAVALVVLAVAGGLAWLIWRPGSDDSPTLSGYIEGDVLQLAAPVAGLISQLSVADGDRIESGATLFVMDPRSLDAQQAEARAQVTQGRTQVAAAEAAQSQAAANARAQDAVAANARGVAERYAALRRADPGALAAQELDQAVADARAATAQAEAARRQAAAAQAQVANARAGVERAGAGLTELGVRADLLSARAPAGGRIERVYFQQGEWAGANQPVVSLLPDARVKLRFYVPERQVAAYRPGVSVRFRCDGCGSAERSAVINYVSPRPEFTPPIIYSRESRDRLVFLVEARPHDPASLTPGLPVDVTPLAGAGR
jgi:HlyD family secretion protein